MKTIFRKSNALKKIMLVMLFGVTGIVTAGSKNESQTQHNARYYAARAQNFEDSGTWEAAKREVDDGLEIHPNDPDLLYLNGRYYYYAQGDLQQARYNLIKALQENDQHYQAKRVLVDVEDESKHYSSAICYINELLEFEPYDKNLWRRKIALYAKTGNRQQADEALERLARIYPNDSIIRRDLNNRLRENWNTRIQRSSINDAAVELEGWIDLDPNNLDYYLELINIYYRLGQNERAIGTANRGLAYHPGNAELIRKAASMMAEVGNYTRALAFLREHRSTGALYNDILREAVSDARLRDPYESSGRLYATTKDNDALTYLINTSVVRGYYPDAIEYLGEAYRKYGERPDLLMKQYGLEKRFGNDAKALAVLEKLYNATPTDADIIDEYADMMLTLTDHDIETEQWAEAYEHIDKALSLMSPDTIKWPAVVSRKINILGHLNKLDEARQLYLESTDTMPQYKERFGSAYEEVAAVRLKQLMENEEYARALEEARDLLALVDDSEAALRTCINMSQTLNRNDLFREYAAIGYEKYPNSPYFIIKKAVALQQEGKNDEAMALLRPDKYNDEYLNPQLMNAHSGIAEEYAGLLLKEKKPELAMEKLDTALQYDATNRELLYLKGVAYEQMKDYGQAWDYQYKYYNPSNAEQQQWQQHMRYLKYRSYKNRVEASYTAGYFDTRNEELASIGHLYSIATVTYSRLAKNNTYTGQISYKGMDGYQDIEYNPGGFGLEFLAQWEHVFSQKWSGMANISYGTKFFNLIGANVSASLTLPKGWVPSLKLGYRLTSPTYNLKGKEENVIKYDYRRYNLFILTPSITKSWERINVAGAVDLFAMGKGIYYNVGLKGKVFINDDNISSVGLLAGFGSFPELNFFDQSALTNITHSNAMVGIEGMYLLTNNFALSLNGSWNTYYNPLMLPEGGLRDAYRNVFSFSLGLHVAF
ncbi:MAG: tetratricopeptide repeat protein [Muribaculaceae bacterium]|nr:tetratricopeptide repeat protein [Muribaculaceae bacterium]